MIKHVMIWMLAAIWLIPAAPAPGQVEVRCRLSAPQALMHSTVRLRVTVLNNSGQPLLFDGGRLGADLRLEVERADGRIMNPLSDLPMAAGMEVLAGETREFDLELTRLFDLHACGSYKIRAVADMGRTMSASPDATLIIVSGFELARLRAGVAGDPDALRLYVLEYLQTPAGENLYLRIEDERTRAVYGVFDLGALVRTRPPALLLDESTNIHVLFQSKNMAYIHASFTPYGVALLSESTPASPHGDVHLKRDDGGRVILHIPPAPAPAAAPPASGKPRRER